MRRIRGTVEEDEHPQRLILSMRMKLFLGCLGFVLAMGIIAYLETPNAVQALRSLGQVTTLPENESKPQEQEEPQTQVPSTPSGLSSGVGWRYQITISADGSIDAGGGTPWHPAAPIYRDGDTYIILEQIPHCSICVLRSNIVIDGEGHTITGPPGYPGSVTGPGTGLTVYSDNVTVRNLTMTGFGTGVSLTDTENCVLANCKISGNELGIRVNFGWDISDSRNNLLIGNTVSHNQEGISISSTNLTLIGNMVSDSTLTGIRVGHTNHTAYHNNLINNTQQVRGRPSGVTWDGGPVTGGNYWDDYAGMDNDSNGIGDSSHLISCPEDQDTPGEDRYPLMKPSKMPEPTPQPILPILG